MAETITYFGVRKNNSLSSAISKKKWDKLLEKYSKMMENKTKCNFLYESRGNTILLYNDEGCSPFLSGEVIDFRWSKHSLTVISKPNKKINTIDVDSCVTSMGWRTNVSQIIIDCDENSKLYFNTHSADIFCRYSIELHGDNRKIHDSLETELSNDI